MAKKFYWFKLGESFFQDDKIKLLMARDNGDRYLVALLRLMVKCLPHEDAIMPLLGESQDEVVKNLATICDTDVDVMLGTLKACHSLGIIDTSVGEDERTLQIPLIHDMVGSKTDAAIRMKRMRDRNKAKESALTGIENHTENDGDESVTSLHREKNNNHNKNLEGERQNQDSLPSFCQRVESLLNENDVPGFVISKEVGEQIDAFGETYGRKALSKVLADYAEKKTGDQIRRFFHTDFPLRLKDAGVKLTPIDKPDPNFEPDFKALKENMTKAVLIDDEMSDYLKNTSTEEYKESE